MSSKVSTVFEGHHFAVAGGNSGGHMTTYFETCYLSLFIDQHDWPLYQQLVSIKDPQGLLFRRGLYEMCTVLIISFKDFYFTVSFVNRCYP